MSATTNNLESSGHVAQMVLQKAVERQAACEVPDCPHLGDCLDKGEMPQGRSIPSLRVKRHHLREHVWLE